MASISALIKISDGFSTPLQNFANRLGKAGSALAGLKGKLGGFGNLKPPTPDFDRFNGVLGQTKGLFASMVGANVIGGAITGGIHAATGALGGMIGELNESSTAWQTFNGNMQMVGLNKNQIAAARTDMQKFAQDTIYSSSDMASTYAQFAAVGVKDAGRLVKGFGGLAAAATNPQQAMKTLSEQSVQAAAKPKVQWADFRLMMEQTPAGIAQVAKTMGKSMQSLILDVQAGKVKTQDFFNAIAKTGTNKQFTKMATQYKTVGQAMDGLKETLANKMQPAFDKVSKVGINAVSKLVDAVGNVNFDSMANKIAPVAQRIMNTITSVVKYVGGAFQRFWAGIVDSGAVSAVGDAFNAISSSIGKVFGALGKGGGDPFGMFRNIGSIIGGAVAGAANVIQALAKALSNLPPGMIQALAGAFIALKFGMKGLLFTAVIAGLKGLSKMNPGQIRLLAGALTALAAGITAVKVAQKIKSGIDFFKSFKKPTAPATPKTPKTPAPSTPNVPDPSPLNPKWLQLGAVLLMVGAAVLLVAGGFYIMAQAAINLANSGGAAIAIFFGFIVALGILIAVVSAFGPALIVGAVGLLIFGAAMLLIGVATFIAAAGLSMLATQLPIIAQYGAMAALNILLLGAAIAVFGALAIVGAIGLIALSVALVVAGVAMIVAAVGAVLLGAAAFVLAAGIMAVAVACMLLGAALMVIAMGFQMLISVIANAVNGIVNAVQNGFNAVKNAVSNGIQGAVGTVKGMVGEFVSAGANLMKGLADGIASGVGWVIDKAKSVASGVSGAVKGMLGIHSPSRVFAGFGRYLDAGLEIGINSHMNRPINTAGDLASGVADAMSPLQNGFNVGMNVPNTPQAPITSTTNPANDVPTSNPFKSGNFSGNTTNATNNNNPNTNHIDRSVNIAPGAIVVNGGSTNEETGESIVQKMETYLKNKQNGGEGYGYN